MHGRDWDEVYARYAPLVPFIRHRADLTYVLDQMNGELSVGHSFVFGGDYPETDDSKAGLLGADLVADQGHWRIDRIYTFESWNPDVSAPLDRPGLNIEEGHYIVAVNGTKIQLTVGAEESAPQPRQEPQQEKVYVFTVTPEGKDRPWIFFGALGGALLVLGATLFGLLRWERATRPER